MIRTVVGRRHYLLLSHPLTLRLNETHPAQPLVERVWKRRPVPVAERRFALRS